MSRRLMITGLALLAMLGVLATGSQSIAASSSEIDSDVRTTMERLFAKVPGSRDLANQAAGILVFPTVVKAGFGIGGEYGEGALMVDARPQGYYNMISASIGFQLGAQSRSIVIMFMSPEALAKFHRVDGWKAGVDGSVTLVTIGAGGSIDTNTVNKPVIGFVLDSKGLMYNLTLEGSKISRISR